MASPELATAIPVITILIIIIIFEERISSYRAKFNLKLKIGNLI